MRLRILRKTSQEGDIISAASSLSSNPSDYSQEEFEQLRKLGGDILLTFHSHERYGLGALYLGRDETYECQRKRNERLDREKEQRKGTVDVQRRKREGDDCAEANIV